MKYLYIVLALLISQVALAADSESMVKLLQESGVPTWGRKQNLQANVDCKINRHQAFRCVVSADIGTNYKIYIGDDADKISELLKTFDIRPVGKKRIQEASILCQIKKGEDAHTCFDLSYDYPTN